MTKQPRETRNPSPSALIAGVIAIAGFLVVLLILNS
jgi:hypothetical protein